MRSRALASLWLVLLITTCAPSDEGEELASMSLAFSQGLVPEVEPNGTSGQATPITGDGVVIGNIAPTGDIDTYAFTGAMGDRVYAADMVAFSASAADSAIDLRGTDGMTLIENDLDNGSL